MSKYEQVVRAVAERPWAIRRETLDVIVALVAERASGAELTEEEIRARIGSNEAARAPYAIEVAAAAGSQRPAGIVQVLPLYGVLIPRATLFSDVSGATSLQRFSAALRAAIDDPDIGAILVDVDSPGGMVDGCTELAADIRSYRGTKPMAAIANHEAASAAYWLATQFDEVLVTPSGQAGSIGVFSAHDDVSAAMAKLGVKRTLISAGKYKTEGNPYEPLSEEALDHYQEQVNDYYGLFTGDVAKARGVEASAVRAGYGEGRMLTAKRALKAGMVDRIETFEAAATRLGRAAAGRPRRRAGGFRGITGWAPDAAARLGTPLNDTDTMDGPEHEPYAEHAERVVADVEALVDRSRARRDSRAKVARDLSAADRGRLAAVRDQLSGILPELDELLAGDTPATDEAAEAFARFVEQEARLNGVAV